jgi:hypothetical protein
MRKQELRKVALISFTNFEYTEGTETKLRVLEQLVANNLISATKYTRSSRKNQELCWIMGASIKTAAVQAVQFEILGFWI